MLWNFFDNFHRLKYSETMHTCDVKLQQQKCIKIFPFFIPKHT